MTQRHPVTVEPSPSYLVLLLLLVLVYRPLLLLPLSLSFSIFLFRRSYLSRSRQRELYRPKAFIRPHRGSKVGRARTLNFNYRVRRGSYRRSGTRVAGLAWKRTAVRPCYLFRAYFTARALLFSKGARFSIRCIRMFMQAPEPVALRLSRRRLCDGASNRLMEILIPDPLESSGVSRVVLEQNARRNRSSQ